ncbi:hypothetical protein D3C87_175270 [compost metagenome]
MKIKSVSVNNRKKTVEIELVNHRVLTLPFEKLQLKPSAQDPLVGIYVDSELAQKAVTYTLKSGKEDSIHLEAFLDFNKDPDYLKNLLLYKLTLEVLSHLKKSSLSKNEITRRLKTSPSQLARLLDPKNKTKTVDNMLKLLAVLGCEVELKVKAA